MKRTLATALAAVTFVSAAPAFAADFILTDDGLVQLTPTVFSKFSVDPSSTATTVSAFLSNAPGNGTFLDRFIFAPGFLGFGSGAATTNFQTTLTFGLPGLRIDGYSLAAAGGVGAALVSAFSTGSASTYNSNVATVTAYLNGLNGINEPFAPVVSSNEIGDDPTPVYSQLGVPSLGGRQLFGVPLDPANFYVISIDGSSSSSSAVYSGNLTATSVPEPATWAMMLAGFGLVGFAMRRQRQTHPKVRFAF